jgi:hypothetical protein
MGLVHNGGGLIAARFFLGVAEAGLFPGVNVRKLARFIRFHSKASLVLFVMLV